MSTFEVLSIALSRRRGQASRSLLRSTAGNDGRSGVCSWAREPRERVVQRSDLRSSTGQVSMRPPADPVNCPGIRV
jgi:hypothetical protein